MYNRLLILRCGQFLTKLAVEFFTFFKYIEAGDYASGGMMAVFLLDEAVRFWHLCSMAARLQAKVNDWISI